MFHISLGSIANRACIDVIQQYFERQLSVGHDITQSFASGTGCVLGATETLDGPVWTLSVLLQLCGGYSLSSSLPWAQTPHTQIQNHTCFLQPED